MQAFDLVVSEEMIFHLFPIILKPMADNHTARDMACTGPRGTVGRIYKDDFYA